MRTNKAILCSVVGHSTVIYTMSLPPDVTAPLHYNPHGSFNDYRSCYQFVRYSFYFLLLVNRNRRQNAYLNSVWSVGANRVTTEGRILTTTMSVATVIQPGTTLVLGGSQPPPPKKRKLVDIIAASLGGACLFTPRPPLIFLLSNRLINQRFRLHRHRPNHRGHFYWQQRVHHSGPRKQAPPATRAPTHSSVGLNHQPIPLNGGGYLPPE